MDQKFFEGYTPKMDDQQLDYLANYFEKRDLLARGVTFIAFLYFYEKGVWIW